MFQAIAVGASLAGLALDAYGKTVSAEGDAKAMEFKAEQAEKRAEFGRLRAVQTDAQLLEELNSVLGNIDAVRAASNIDPTSPTSAAIKTEEARVSDRARRIKVDSILAQAKEDQDSAAFYRENAETARTSGYLSAGGSLLKGAGGAFSSLGKK